MNEAFWFFLGLGLGLGMAVAIFNHYEEERVSPIECICIIVLICNIVLICISIWFLLDTAFTGLLNFAHYTLGWF